MTTLAYDGKTLAADSMLTEDDTKFCSGVAKVFKLKDGRVFAFAGSYAFGHRVLDWIADGCSKENKPIRISDEEGFVGCIIDIDGEITEIDKYLRPMPMMAPWAAGSGQLIANVVLSMGFCAKFAVEKAKEFDLYSGGPTTWVNIREGVVHQDSVDPYDIKKHYHESEKHQ